jgi:hypothetical protein
MVLRSDSKRFNEELAAAEESSRENVIEKWKSLVLEREEVGDCWVSLRFRQLRCFAVLRCYGRVGETRGTSKRDRTRRNPKAEN